jgi:hypothetical protein
MTQDEMIAWIDNASYYDLLSRWRFSAAGDPFFIEEVGNHFTKVMKEKRNELSQEECSRISKQIGW